MKLAVSASGNDLDAQLDPRFGRCAFFLVIDPDDMSFEAFQNRGALQGGGAGIQSGQLLSSAGVDAVITGNCGPNAVQTLSTAGIELFTCQAGTVREVVARFKKGHLKPTNRATVDSHFGIETGSGRGGGMGRGMAGGTGGRSAPPGSGSKASQRNDSSMRSRDQEMEDLKQQASRLNRMMKEVIARINRLASR
ncbi:MAG: NifB/NifX family molybdenum-iron cluster-binding protein [Deltaproteobacteria bacterium]|nr:NifB/NifX family molybdenum-iron cluster-binding protein [Deltaproteobacteria bacterium]